MLVSGQSLFSLFRDPMKEVKESVGVRIGGYFLSSLSLCRKLLIHSDSSMDGQTEIHSRADMLDM